MGCKKFHFFLFFLVILKNIVIFAYTIKQKVMKIGDKIKSFEVKQIVKGLGKTYDCKGNKTTYETEYMLLLSDNGQERVLEVGKSKLNDCLTWTTTFGSKHKFITWNQL